MGGGKADAKGSFHPKGSSGGRMSLFRSCFTPLESRRLSNGVSLSFAAKKLKRLHELCLRNHSKFHSPVFRATFFRLIISNGFLTSIALGRHSVARNVEFVHNIFLGTFRSLL